MRLFVAIDPSADVRARLHAAARELREGAYPFRWVRPENVHLTLKFLGEVHEDRKGELSGALDAATARLSGFDLSVDGFGAFPSLRRPRVVWAGIERSAELERLQARVEEELAALGFEREERGFHPHLTLGRAQRHARSAEFGGFDELLRELEYTDRIEVRAVHLMRSRLRPSGAIYDALHSANLSG